MTNEQRNAIVIVIDGWQTNLIGCYGNTWIKTPELDQLAAESFIFDQAILESVELDEVYRSWWSEEKSLSLSGVAQQVITDEEKLTRFLAHGSTAEPIFVPPPNKRRMAEEISETHFANLFAVATDWLLEPSAPFCLWLHSRGLWNHWDAPYNFRKQYADQDDPPPPDLVVPPSRILDENFDPDELLGFQQAYAGQVALLDTCLGTMLDTVREKSNTLIIVAGCRGFPLGEHRVVGDAQRNAFSELIHFPLLVRDPTGRGQLARSSALVKPSDIRSTLTEWFRPNGQFIDSSQPSQTTGLWPLILGERTELRDRIATRIGDQEHSLRTVMWHLRSLGSDPSCSELYVKPDDRFEANDVSSRCGEVVAALQQAGEDLAKAQTQTTVLTTGTGDADNFPPLPEAATHAVV